MSRPPATTVYYGLEFLLHADVGRRRHLPRERRRTYAVSARRHGDSDGGAASSSRCRPASSLTRTAESSRSSSDVLSAHSASCRARLRTMAALRPLGCGASRTPSRAAPTRLGSRTRSESSGSGRVPPGAPVLRRSAGRPGSVGPDRHPVRRGRRRRGRGGHLRLAGSVHRRDARDRLSAPAPEERTGTFGELSTTALAGARFVRGHPVPLTLLGIAFFMGTASEAFDRLKEAHFIREVGLPPSATSTPWCGLAASAAIAMLFGFFAVGALQRRFERRGTESTRLRVHRGARRSTARLRPGQARRQWRSRPCWRRCSLDSCSTALGHLGEPADHRLKRARDSELISGQADAPARPREAPCLASLETAWNRRARARRPAPGCRARAYARAIRHGGRDPEPRSSRRWRRSAALKQRPTSTPTRASGRRSSRPADPRRGGSTPSRETGRREAVPARRG